MPLSRTSHATELLRDYWSGQPRLRPAVGFSSQEIAQFQNQHGLMLPIDFADYVEHLDGLAKPTHGDEWGQIDREGFEFYSLHNMRPTPQSSRYFVFGSWVLGLLDFAICLDPLVSNGEVVSVRDSLHVVATTFTEFAELYVTDSPKIYACGTNAIYAPQV